MKQPCDCQRRSFLKGSGITLAGFGVMSLLPGALIEHAMASTSATNGKRLIFIFLRGGNDGLNALIPHGDPDYNTVTRPTLYIAPADAINLNGFVSLHPALQPLKAMYDSNDLAVMHRVGYADSSHSHFDGQRIWENGDPSQPKLFEGWLYRYLRQQSGTESAALPVLTAQATAPLLLRGDQSYLNIANPDEFDFLHMPPKRDKYSGAWGQRYSNLHGLQRYRPMLSEVGLNLIDTLDLYRSWDQTNWNPLDPDTGYALFPVSDATNPDDPNGPGGKKFATTSYEFFKSLKICALAMLENADTSVAGTQLGGWDLHDGQGSLAGDHATLLSWLGYGIRSLQVALSGAAIDDRSYPSIWQDTVD